MSGYVFPVLVLVTWVAIGLASVVFLGRHGRRSAAWYAIGVALGPILLPIALELAQREGMLLTRSAPETGEAPRLTVLAAVDGSRESDDSLVDAARVLAPKGAQFILLTVMDPDVGDHDPEARRRAEELLRSRADRLPEGCLPPVFEVASGEPARVVLDRAAAGAVDLVVMGRRGRGLSERILGSVADHVVRRSPRPVLLGSARG
ncbi:MAG TPA: universal stress protein [Nocardioidaceae bacterium]